MATITSYETNCDFCILAFSGVRRKYFFYTNVQLCFGDGYIQQNSLSEVQKGLVFRRKSQEKNLDYELRCPRITWRHRTFDALPLEGFANHVTHYVTCKPERKWRPLEESLPLRVCRMNYFKTFTPRYEILKHFQSSLLYLISTKACVDNSIVQVILGLVGVSIN